MLYMRRIIFKARYKGQNMSSLKKQVPIIFDRTYGEVPLSRRGGHQRFFVMLVK